VISTNLFPIPSSSQWPGLRKSTRTCRPTVWPPRLLLCTSFLRYLLSQAKTSHCCLVPKGVIPQFKSEVLVGQIRGRSLMLPLTGTHFQVDRSTRCRTNDLLAVSSVIMISSARPKGQTRKNLCTQFEALPRAVRSTVQTMVAVCDPGGSCRLFTIARSSD